MTRDVTSPINGSSGLTDTVVGKDVPVRVRMVRLSERSNSGIVVPPASLFTLPK